MKTSQVRSNFRYQREIERSFAVIYHNLKRIRDDTPLEGNSWYSHTKQPKPASQQSRPLVGGNLESAKEASTKVKGRRVSFSVDINQI